ncbi:alpha/beta hydrolase [Mycobacterium sp. CBMA271]|uniref:alpha/beta hydrolase n=1 Tax=unclassified Mycobacteroides TaxID=2618759 RepID=UPI0012DC230C|nr:MULTISPECIES: alpha/beta hydrolase [unclassified Mycobacteroides]MUM19593.1 alpha/beta hydrolase [Mycobacteroides sp. CBMA 326]MUM24195.1 alpha/beta hydrolase [Mycobacteroides sp. CBMA 271]
MVVTLHPKTGIVARLPFLFVLLFVKPILALFPTTEFGLRQLKWLDQGAQRGPDAPGIERTRISLADRPTDLMVPAGTIPADSDTAILYLHGGAFIACGPATHRKITGLLSRQLKIPVYVLDYRQLPVAGVGSSVEDAVRAYRELLADYARVIVVGDSAGGFLCGKVIEHAHVNGLPKPVAYVGYSPLLDLDLGINPTSTSRHDAYLPKGKLAKLAPKFDRGPAEFTGERRIVSVPVEAYPPTLLITAQDEFLEPDAIELAEKLSGAGVVAQVHSYAWQLHAFPAIAVSRDTAEAVVLSADFIREALSVAEQGPAAEQAG